MTATGGCGSVYTEASTVKVVNNEERMALSQQQQQEVQEKQQQEEEEYDLKHHPLSCMDNACDAMVGLFGAGSDKQDEDLESTVGTQYTNMVAYVTPQKQDATEQHQQQQQEEDTPQALSKELPREESAASTTDTAALQPAPVTPETKRTFSFIATPKKSNTKSSIINNSNNKKKSNKQLLRVAPTGVTVDDDQVEARRKNRFGKWWKKKFQKDAKQRSKSVPRSRQTHSGTTTANGTGTGTGTGTDTVPPSPSTVADYVDMSNVYNEPLPNYNNEDTQSAASFTPRGGGGGNGDSDSEEEEDLSSVNVWKELNDMWEESGHDMVRVISDNLSVRDGGATAAKEQDILTKYEQTIAAEQLLEAAQRKEKNDPFELTV